MKISNIAIAGVLVTVFGLVDTANATTIASQAYVDAKDGLKLDKTSVNTGTLSSSSTTTVPSESTVATALSAKQDKLNAGTGGNVSVDNTSTTAASRAITGITATGDGSVTFTTQPISVDAPAASTYVVNHDTSALSISTDDTDKAPSVKAVKGMATTSVRAKTSAVDTLVPTEKAVATALELKQDASNSKVANGTYNYITQGNNVASNLVALDTRAKTNADDISNLNSSMEAPLSKVNQNLLGAYNTWVNKGRDYTSSNWTDLAAMLAHNDPDVDNVVADYQEGHQDLIPRNRNIQKGVLYMEGSGIENLTDVANPDSKKSWDFYDGRNDNIKNIRTAKDMDKYVPTVAAVESRVLAAMESAVSTAGTNIGNLKDTNDAATTSSGATTLTVRNGDDDHFYTADAVEAGFSAVNTAIGNMALTDVAGTGDNAGKPVLSVSQSNGKVSASIGQIKAAGIEDNAVTTDKINAKAVTAAKIADNTITAGQIASDAVDTDEIKNSAVTSAKIADDAVTTDKIKDGNVTASKLADNAVEGGSGGKIKDKTVTYNYDMNNTALYDINTGAVPSGTVCTEDNPCILTYYKKGGKVYTRWTPMDTENTAPNSAATDAGATI